MVIFMIVAGASSLDLSVSVELSMPVSKLVTLSLSELVVSVLVVSIVKKAIEQYLM